LTVPYGLPSRYESGVTGMALFGIRGAERQE
jgi:hypothetical protein